MGDCLLQGREDGRPVISLSTLRQKHGPGLKAAGAVFQWHRGRAGRPVIAGWKNIIMNYFIRLQQQTYEEKKGGKTYKGKL